MKRIVKLFRENSVSVSGMKGRGKDMLFANVIARRKIPYVSNTNYGGHWIPLDLSQLNTNNTYRNFITGTLKPYVWPYDDKVDIYMSDCGIYFPAQYCNELNRDFGFMATTEALTRHLGDCGIHFNSQRLSRVWDKIREQSDCYILCKWICKPLLKLTRGKIVLQKVIVYDRYESAQAMVPPFPLRRPLVNIDRQAMYDLQKANYMVAHGEIKVMWLLYWNKSNYDTRAFKEMLENA